MNILELLKTKPHNLHYLKRYVKYIEACRIKNSVHDKNSEIHHILPKAVDLFPEYVNLKTNPWNSIMLTWKQHIIAHVILYKAYGGSQITALHYMLNVQNKSTYYNQRIIPTVIQIRYALKLKEEFIINRMTNGWEQKRITAVSAACKGAETWTDGNRNYFILPGMVPPPGSHKGMKHRLCNHYYVNKDKTDLLVYEGHHDIPKDYQKIKEHKAIAIKRHISLLNFKIETIDEAKEFVKLCMNDDNTINVNMSVYAKLHENKLRKVTGYYKIQRQDLLKCIRDNIEPPQCKCCGEECKTLVADYCSMTCRSKMKKINTKKSRLFQK